MKSFIFLLGFWTATMAHAQKDTITYERPNIVQIVNDTKKDSTTITVKSDDGKDLYQLKTSTKSQNKGILNYCGTKKPYLLFTDLHNDFNLAFIYANAKGDTPDFHSRGWELWWQSPINLHYIDKKTRLGAHMTLGFDWRRYASPDNQYFNLQDNQVTTFVPYEGESKLDHSWAKVYSTTLTLAASYYIYKSIHIDAGPVLSFNSSKRRSATVSTKTKDNNRTDIVNVKRCNIRPVTLDWMAHFHLENIGVYYKFSPQSIFKDNYGPDFSSHTVGLSIRW